ncbi:MAG: murein biosynthesis integral membrane protein MurJ [Candidatus Portnoybacteria bacterium CG03_land_8_20_14_0_80_41_10]|uniref:Probable lipid II flippase MurJ n=1 Tax=Candidatus Portnoybacteria bacterium CG03_land_8_20_14_0_80_41_10 TaxID=1974808 RepID=A0A2M7BU03_9BACT|nr:MAG: murein biosynthesis integral membrane protein MurJ [Candidatus Portnoybacteria bacterium CG03_land_8_20_14_0_80_41_10]
MIKSFFNSPSRTIAAAAVVLGAASLISRLLGLFRDRILAGRFGAGDELDIYYAAFRIPDMVYSLLVLGAVSAGFIPVFINYLQKDKKQTWSLANSVLNLMALSLIVVCALLIVLAPWLAKLVAPGFSSEKLSLTVQLTRVMFLSPFFLGLSAVFGGILQSFRRFLVYSLGPIMYNLGIIFGTLVLVDYFGLLGLAYGVVLGAFFHMLIQIPPAHFCGFRWRPVFDFRFSGVRRIFKLMPPRILSLALSQINFWLMTVFASFLAVGSIAVYNLAYNIWSFPLGVFGISFVLAAFPKLSQTAQKKNIIGFVKTFSLTLRQILFLTLPSAALFIVLREEIVRVILGVGRFSWPDTLLTFQTLAYFSIGLFAEALILLFLRGFFAWEDTKTPFLIGLLAMAFRLPVAWFLAQKMGVSGLALGFSFGSIFYLILLFIALRRKIAKKLRSFAPQFMKSEAPKNLDEKNIFLSGGKMILASGLAALAAYLSLQYLASLVDTATGLGLLFQGGLAGLFGLLIYLLCAWLFRLTELKLFLTSLFGRSLGKKYLEG